MKSFAYASKALAAAAFCARAVVADLDPIVIKASYLLSLSSLFDSNDLILQGSKFFYKSNGTEL